MAVIDGFNINGTVYDVRDKAAVHFDETQALTGEQKAQARANIDAASVDEAGVSIPEYNLQKALYAAVGAGYPVAGNDSSVYFADDEGNIGIILRKGFDSENAGGITYFYHPDFPNGAIVDKDGNILGVLNAANGATALKGKKLSILGDSISSYVGEVPDGYYGYYPRGDVQNPAQTWWGQLLNKTGMELLVNASWGGTKVTGDTSVTTGATGCSMARINALKSGSVTPDIIICYIGTNDWASHTALGEFDSTMVPDTTTVTITNLADAYALMLYRLRTTYPDARIYCMTSLEGRLLPNDDSYPVLNNNGKSIHEANHIMAEIAHIFGAKVVDLQTCGIHYWNIAAHTVDGNLHPNAAGHAKIAHAVFEHLKTDFE